MSDSDYEASYEYLCRTCGHHERKHAGYPLACVVCDSHNLLRTPLFREPKPGEYDIWARDQHIEVLKAEIDALRAENAALAGERDRLRVAAANWALVVRMPQCSSLNHHPDDTWTFDSFEDDEDYSSPAPEIALLSALGEEPTDAG